MTRITLGNRGRGFAGVGEPPERRWRGTMLIINDEYKAVDRVATFMLYRADRERMTTYWRFFGRLVAYLPHLRRAHYAWLFAISYRPSLYVSVHQFCPPQLRLAFLGRWEFGLVLGYWGLGRRLGQPLIWLRRLQAA